MNATADEGIVDIDGLSRDQLGGLMIYMTGLSDAIMQVNAKFRSELATYLVNEGGVDSAAAQALIPVINNWQATLGALQAEAERHVRAVSVEGRRLN